MNGNQAAEAAQDLAVPGSDITANASSLYNSLFKESATSCYTPNYDIFINKNHSGTRGIFRIEKNPELYGGSFYGPGVF